MKKPLILALAVLLAPLVLALGGCSTGSQERMADNAANRTTDEALSRALQR